MQNLRSIDILPYIPHRSPALLVTHLVSVEENLTITEYIVDENCLFLKEDKSLESCVYIELMAQSFAVGSGYLKNNKELQFGFLAAVRELTVHAKAFLGDTIKAVTKKTAEFGNVLLIEGELFVHENSIASGQFKIYIPDTEQNF